MQACRDMIEQGKIVAKLLPTEARLRATVVRSSAKPDILFKQNKISRVFLGKAKLSPDPQEEQQQEEEEVTAVIC